MNNNTEFVRDMSAYTVLNNDDVFKYLNDSQRNQLASIVDSIYNGRVNDNQPLRNSLVITDKYSELYDIAWKLMEKEIRHFDYSSSDNPTVLHPETVKMIQDKVGKMSFKITDKSGKASLGHGSSLSAASIKSNLMKIISSPRYLELAYSQVKTNDPVLPVVSAIDESIKLIIKMYFNSFSYRVTADVSRISNTISIIISEHNYPPTYSFVRYLMEGESPVNCSKCTETSSNNSKSISIMVMDSGICKWRKLNIENCDFEKNKLQLGDPVFISLLNHK